MSKKTKSSTGTTDNPAPQPTAAAAPAPAPQAPAPKAAAKAQAKGKPTAGPAPQAPVAETDEFLSEALSQIGDALDVGSDGTTQLGDALEEGSADAADSSDETPADTEETAEATGEAAETDELAGDPTEESLDSDEETAGEAEADPDEDDDGDDEDDDLDQRAEEKNWPPSFLKRLKRERRKARRMEAELAQLKAKGQPGEAKEATEDDEAETPAPTAVGAVTTEESRLTSEISSLEKVLDFIEENPSGATVNGKEWSAEQLRAERRATERKLRILETQLYQVQQDRKEVARRFEQHTREFHPWMANKAHPARAKVEEIIRNYPALKSIPEARFWISSAIAYTAQRNQALAKNGKPNGKLAATSSSKPAPPAPRPTGRTVVRPGAVPQPANGRRAAVTAAEKKFFETGDHEAGIKLLESTLLG